MTPGLQTPRLLALLLAFAAAGSPLLAQSPRIALIEEVSNASCAPCATENPVFERFLALPEQAAAAITIVYHGNWPGRDTMNAIAPDMNAARVAYYGITGAPRVVVNGAEPKGSTRFWRDGAPADLVALDSAIDIVRGTISPITIRIDQQRRGDSLTVTVDLESIEAVAGKNLRVVLVESEHYYRSPTAGTNGEEHFLYIARAMLPSPEGTAIDLPAGGARRVVHSAAIDPEWNERSIYAVAFLQDDSTREVLQAATARGAATLVGGDPAAFRVLDTATSFWSFEGASADTNSYLVEVDADLPPNWLLSATSDGAPVKNGDLIRLAPGDTPRFDVRMTPDIYNPGRGSFRLTLRGERGAVASREGRVYAGDIDLLALRRDNDDLPIEDLYTPGLRLSPLSWAMVEPEDERLLEIDSAEILTFLVGSRALYSSDIVLLKGYLDGGGRLFLIGSEVAWGLAAPENDEEKFPRDPAFLQNQLRSRFVAGASSTNAVNGVAGDPVGAGINLRLRDEFEVRTTPDRITPVPPARTALSYGSTRTDAAAVRYANDSTRILFFSFGFESIADSAIRSTLVERGIRWLLGSDLTLTAPSLDIAGVSVGLPSPNPTFGRTGIPIALAHAATVRLRLLDIVGREALPIHEQHLPGGAHTLEIETGGLPAGVYLATIEIGGARVTRRVVVGDGR